MLSKGRSVETILGKETTMLTISLRHLVIKGLLLIVKLLMGNFLIEKEICLLLYCPLKSTASPCCGKRSKDYIWVT